MTAPSRGACFACGAALGPRDVVVQLGAGVELRACPTHACDLVALADDVAHAAPHPTRAAWDEHVALVAALERADAGRGKP